MDGQTIRPCARDYGRSLLAKVRYSAGSSTGVSGGPLTKLSGAGEIVYVDSHEEMMEFLAHNPNVTQSGTGGAAGSLGFSYGTAVVFDDAPGEDRILSYTVLYNASAPHDMAAELMKAVDTALGMCSSRGNSQWSHGRGSEEQGRV